MPGCTVAIVEKPVLLAFRRVQFDPVSCRDHLLDESPGRREQFIIRTSRGRVAMPRSFELLGKPQKRQPGEGPSLFDPRGD